MWVLPTLDRYDQCFNVVEKIKDLKCSTPGILFLNGQTSAWEYFGQEIRVPKGWDIILSKKNVGALGALKRVFELYPNEPWYGFLADDEFVQTPEFDTKVVEAAGAWDIAHGDDGVHKGERFQGTAVIGGELARAVGCLALEECWHWYGFDSMWESLAQAGACRRVFVPEVKVNHWHPYHGTAAMDECYRIGESRKDIDQQVYYHWLRHGIKGVVERVRKAKEGG